MCVGTFLPVPHIHIYFVLAGLCKIIKLYNSGLVKVLLKAMPCLSSQSCISHFLENFVGAFSSTDL